MWKKLKEVVKRHEEIGEQLSSAEVIADRALFQKLSKEHKDLTPLVASFCEYEKIEKELADSKELIAQGGDAGLLQMAKEEAAALSQRVAQLENELKLLLLPKDPNDEKNVILEIRAGTGGDESAIFAGELFRLYMRYSEGKRWRVEPLQLSGGSAGGYKEIIAMIGGVGAYSRLKFEKGVHRVQRVPATETQGRIHTSTVTVAVLPEAEEVDIEINEKDLRIDVYRSSGPGGQSVNTTDSAVRITHLPTNTVVAMQDEKSQIKNREKAMRVLRARLLEKKQAEQDAARRDERRSQVGTGERSEKVRTYNFPQSRITDHRIGLTIHSIDQVMNGDLDQLVDPLTAHFQAEALKSGGGDV